MFKKNEEQAVGALTPRCIGVVVTDSPSASVMTFGAGSLFCQVESFVFFGHDSSGGWYHDRYY